MPAAPDPRVAIIARLLDEASCSDDPEEWALVLLSHLDAMEQTHGEG